jgi:HPt (histidine-containing phosphotransfer) domain-containing protein
MTSLTTANNAIFGLEELSNRCLNNSQLVKRVLEAFQAGFESDLADLAKRIADMEFDEVAKTAHRMKGAAANAAAYQLFEIASQFETAPQRTPQELESMLTTLKCRWEEFQKTVLE